MIRILHIVHAITKGGGLCNMVMNYYRFIDREKIQFDFLYFRDSEDTFQQEIESLGGRCFKMSEPSISNAFIKERETFFKEHEGEWNAIHCHALFASAVFTKIAKQHKIPYSFSHSHSAAYGTGNVLKRFRNSYFINKSKALGDVHLACSKDAALFMFGKKELQSGRAIIVNNAIDLDKYWFDIDKRKKMRAELSIDNKFVIGHVGGFVPLKNQSYLVDVFYNFQLNHPDSVLLLIGGEGIAAGSTKQLLIDKINQYEISDKVKLLGLRDDVNALDQAMDVFVLPSLFEGLGIALVEAQASGLPCIASPAVPHEAQILDSYTAMNDLEDIDSWVKAIEASMNYGISQRYVDCNKFDGFNITKQCEKLEEVYLKTARKGEKQ